MRDIARSLRKNQTEAERLLWCRIRNNQLGHRFYRQFVFGFFIADFCCRKKGLIIELDGGQHVLSKERDKERTDYLNAYGFKVIRFWNNEVIGNIDGVLEVICGHLNVPDNFPHPSPLPKGRGSRISLL